METSLSEPGANDGQIARWSRPIFVLGAPALLAIVTSMVAIHAGFGLGPSLTDAGEYLNSATSLVTGHGFPRGVSLVWGFHPPLYPLFIAAIWKVFGQHLYPVYAAQAFLFAATAALLARITTIVTRRPSLGLLAGSLFAFDPLVLKEVGTIETEPLEMFLLVLGMFFIVRAVITDTKASTQVRDVVIGGAMFGLGALCRDAAEAILIALAVALWWLMRRKGRRLRWGLPVAMIVTAIVVIAPWAALNWRATGAFIPVSPLGGFNLWLGNNPASLRVWEGRFANEAAFDSYGRYLQSTLPDQQITAWGARYYRASIGGRERMWIAAAFREMEHHPATTAKLWGYKTWGFWRPWLQPMAYSNRDVALSKLVEGVLYAFALVGLVVLIRRREPWPFLGLLLAVVAGSTLVSTIFISNLRYRVPTVDPYLYVLGAVGLAAAVRWSRVFESPRREGAAERRVDSQ